MDFTRYEAQLNADSSFLTKRMVLERSEDRWALTSAEKCIATSISLPAHQRPHHLVVFMFRDVAVPDLAAGYPWNGMMMRVTIAGQIGWRTSGSISNTPTEMDVSNDC